MKEIDSKISAKYNIGSYGLKGVYIERKSKVFKIFNSKATMKENWNEAFDFCQNEGKKDK